MRLKTRQKLTRNLQHCQELHRSLLPINLPST